MVFLVNTVKSKRAHFQASRVNQRAELNAELTFSAGCGLARQTAPFLPHSAPCRLFLVQQRRMKELSQRKECGSCCGLGGSWAGSCGGRASAFWHGVAPGVHDSRSAAGGWVLGGENGEFRARVWGVTGMSYGLRKDPTLEELYEDLWRVKTVELEADLLLKSGAQ